AGDAPTITDGSSKQIRSIVRSPTTARRSGAKLIPTIFRTTARRFRTTIRYSVEKLEHPWSACRNYSQCASHSKHCSKSKICTTPASALRVRNENVMRGVCSHAILCHELVAGGQQFGRSRNNIEASIEYGMLSPPSSALEIHERISGAHHFRLGAADEDALEIAARGRPALPI